MPCLTAGLSGRQVAKGISPLTGRLGEKILSDKITVLADGGHRNSTAWSPFDGEGTATRKAVLFDKGVLTNYIVDRDAAAQLGCAPTGTAFRRNLIPGDPDFGCRPAIGVGNFLIEPGKGNLDTLLAEMGDGLLVELIFDAWMGNTLNGDFSSNASMVFKVEKGKPVGRIKDQTLSGNIYDLLGDQLVALGGEQQGAGFGESFGGGCHDHFTPYLLCKDVNVG